jgi:hypothetical protein
MASCKHFPGAWATAAAALLLAGCLSSDGDGTGAGDAFGLDSGSATTVFAVRNATPAAVTVHITLGPAPTGTWIRNVSQLPAAWGVSGSGLVGSFTLPAQTTRSLTLPAGTGLSGNILFGGDAEKPACGRQPGFPNAATLGEFTLGVPGNGYNGQETVDISNVNGSNVYMDMALVTSNPWNAGAGHPNVTAASSGIIGSNANRIGVFGWQATNCTSSVDPPNPAPGCPAPLNAPPGPELSSQATCTLQRPTNGGTVTFVFNGFTPGSTN